CVDFWLHCAKKYWSHRYFCSQGSEPQKSRNLSAFSRFFAPLISCGPSTQPSVPSFGMTVRATFLPWANCVFALYAIPRLEANPMYAFFEAIAPAVTASLFGLIWNGLSFFRYEAALSSFFPSIE